jgi:hypothetical protein
VLYVDTDISEAQAASIFRAEVNLERMWPVYRRELQGRWSLKPIGRGQEMESPYY